ncbi:MAG TPA: ABC transporter substrate-binding protein [Stellaceae bacterium]|nr:ABC transporter substrate-binding protein [Stellaceae bacterium]
MKWRVLIALIGVIGAAGTLAARGQASGPVIGMLHQGPTPPAQLMSAFRDGLREGGLAEAATIAIEDRAANGQYGRLPALAAELVSHHVAVIASDFLPAGLAAKAATQTIPVVFLTGSDPVASGLVPSLNRPTGNVTGIAFMFTRLGAKNLELLRELVPKAAVVGVLINPSNPNAEPQLMDVEPAARALGQELLVMRAKTDKEIEESFAQLAQSRVDALVVSADGFFIGQQDQLVALAQRYGVPTMYPLSQYVTAGGLMSYGAKLAEAFRQTGIYVGRVLKGEKPADLPVLQSARFELVLNLKTAKALGLTVPPSLLALADEVIE